MKKFVILIIFILLFIILIKQIDINKNVEIKNNNSYIIDNNIENKIVENNQITKINDWRLVLANYDNVLPNDFEVDLASIDRTREVDKRIMSELIQMIKDMRKKQKFSIWVQSAYRNIDRQEEIFNEKVEEYVQNGKSRNEAEELTMQTINKPGTSEHNLGLAVDFNYVNYEFENTDEFRWLKENAQNYGFILRYQKEKEDITKINYEPWHWRYVGVEHAKKINELGLCLEEYIDYLEKNN